MGWSGSLMMTMTMTRKRKRRRIGTIINQVPAVEAVVVRARAGGANRPWPSCRPGCHRRPGAVPMPLGSLTSRGADLPLRPPPPVVVAEAQSAVALPAPLMTMHLDGGAPGARGTNRPWRPCWVCRTNFSRRRRMPKFWPLRGGRYRIPVEWGRYRPDLVPLPMQLLLVGGQPRPCRDHLGKAIGPPPPVVFDGSRRDPWMLAMITITRRRRIS
mmetsp:Transcript_10262/g.22232  ORF Transcript_10262/g.22232 Transcript_10262/m.22232 type:complete len:214 (+) Transcript_10262:443-1084(+)